MQSIGANIKAKRRSLGLHQEDLANKLGLTQANVSRIEASVKGPSGEMMVAFAEALGCDVRELLGIEQSGKPVKELDENTKTFVVNAIKGDPQFGVSLRSFVNDFQDLTNEDWKFLATHLKLALGYAADAIKAKRLKGKF
ncbi:MAG: helix-turn-helix transcriptional regulator [Synergistaceae bacterium]|jgi:transcriptional regulator with XRE-family HTH domain|nr:helix-turn-helix transcriptional regulator [Synergistaceae bacterium]